MRILLQYILLLFAMVSCVDSGVQAPIRLTWQMGSNSADELTYTNSFVIQNVSEMPLDSNWTIYYNQSSRDVMVDETNPVIIKRLNADYFSITPSKHYEQIVSGDSLIVTFKATNGVMLNSHTPIGAFMVCTINGREQQPIPIEIHKSPLEGYNQLNRPCGTELPYASAEWVYEKNASITPCEVTEYDILPSFKVVSKTEGKVTFTSYALEADDALSGELRWLSKLLADHPSLEKDQTDGLPIVLTLEQDTNALVNSEQYNIQIGKEGVILSGTTPRAVYYAIQSFYSIVRQQQETVVLSCADITDYPDLPYRGMMIDVARNFIKKDQLFTLIDLFSTYKLNTLHLHLTDDEGWRLQIPGLEELTDVGARRGYTLDERECLYPAYGSGHDSSDPNSAGNGYYSREDFVEILQYAQQRHIDVMCEIDFPGHARAAIKSMEARYYKYIETDPDKATQYLLTDFDDTSDYVSAQGYRGNAISVALPSTYKFIDKVVAEVSLMYADAGVSLTTMHIGGDEVPRGAWTQSPICQKLMQQKSMEQASELNAYFFNRTAAIFKKHGVTMAGWQELAHGLDTEKYPALNAQIGNVYGWNTVPEWGGDVIPYELANAGYDVILSNVTNFYFDLSYMKHPQERGLFWAGFNDETSSFDMQPYAIYRSCRHNMKGEALNIFDNSVGKIAMNDTIRKYLKGVQGQLFTEGTYTFEQHCYALLPKMFGLVERGWNATPDFSLEDNSILEKQKYLAALNRYYATIFAHELPSIHSKGLAYRVNPAGGIIKDGMLYVNNPNPRSIVRYTLDGTHPNDSSSVWTEPIAVGRDTVVKLQATYLNMHSCVTEISDNVSKYE